MPSTMMAFVLSSFLFGLSTAVRSDDLTHVEVSASSKAMPTLEHPQVAGNPLALNEAGTPIACDVPLCDRSEGCDGAACCNTQMFEAVSAFADWAESKGIDYSLLFGTLLGAYRDNDIIPWTSDIDIGVYRQDVERIFEQTEIPWNFGFNKNLSNARGCEYHHPGFPGKYSGHFELNNQAALDSGPIRDSYYIDLYLIDMPRLNMQYGRVGSTYGGSQAIKHLATSWGENGILQRTTVTIRDKEFRAPLHIEDALVAEYGKNWKIPDPEHSWHVNRKLKTT